MAWETGWYYLNEGQSGEYWVSWGGTPQGLQFITAEPRGGNARLDTTTHGLVSLHRSPSERYLLGHDH
jgi:hypothetical protein